MYVITIDVDGNIREYEEEKMEISYEQLKRYTQSVGIDWLQAIPIEIAGYSYTMWLDDNGKLLGLPCNPIATELAVDTLMPTDFIVGGVVITGRDNTENTPPISPVGEHILLEAINNI